MCFDILNSVYGAVLRISTKSPVSIGSNKMVPCSRSNQCEDLVFLSCQDSEARINYIFSISIENISQQPTPTETNLELVHKSSLFATFDHEIVGINVFTVEYPVNLTCFLVKSDNVWFLTVFEKNKRKVDSNCLKPELENGLPIFCPLPKVASNYSLRYFSISNNSLTMHTSSQNSVQDHVIETCYLMNDCFGCVLISEIVPYTCKWDEDRCISTSINFTQNLFDCIAFEETGFHYSNTNRFVLKVKLSGVILTNTFMKFHLKLPLGEYINANITGDSEAEFLLSSKQRESIEKNPDTTLLLIGNTKLMHELSIPYGSLTRKKSESVVPVILISVLSFALGALLIILLSLLYTRYKDSQPLVIKSFSTDSQL